MAKRKIPSTVQILEREAIDLVYHRAKKERRSYSNAASITIIDALSGRFVVSDDTACNCRRQGENGGKIQQGVINND